jgi:hypothetical protein
MVLTKEELITSLQNEVRILLHLAGKIDRAQLDYRPSPKQRSTLDLLRYLSHMGPVLIPTIKAGKFDVEAWQAEVAKANASDIDQVLESIGRQATGYADQLSGWTDTDFRGEIEMFGRKASRGRLIVELVLAAHAAYRTQLFLYLKACGRDELNTMNLWAGVDAPLPAVT